MRGRWCGVVACVGFLGCDANVDPLAGEASSCGPNPPTFSSFELIDDGETAVVGGEERRVVEISALANDVDGDLHEYTVEIFVDGFVDGNLPSRPTFEVAGTAGVDDSCVVHEAQVGAYIPFGDGTNRGFGETFEIGLIVYDAAGNPSHDQPPMIVEDLPSE